MAVEVNFLLLRVEIRPPLFLVVVAASEQTLE